MKNRIMVLALAAIGAVMFVLPTVASAGEWKIDPASGKFPLSVSTAGGEAKLTASQNITCTSNSGTGRYNTSTTGEIELTFKGCSSAVGECHSSGQPSGVITTTPNLVFHNVIIDTSPRVTGILITPNAGHFATFECFFGILKVVVTGNGIMGEVSEPPCGTSSTTAKLVFSATGGTQKWMQITTTGTKYDLTSSLNGGALETAGQDATATATFGEKATHTC